MRVLVAGAGGVLGREIVNSLVKRKIEVVGLGYKECEFFGLEDKLIKWLCCDVTKPIQLKGICKGIDMVISTIGITRIKTNLTYMDVDFQGNLNLLKEAEASQVKKFVFISPAGTDKGYNYVPLFKAKFLFEQKLKESNLNWVIFRSGAFFNDLKKLKEFTQSGFVFVIGKADKKFTPVDVKELAEIMVEDSLINENKIIDVGGPEDLSWRQVYEMCFISEGKYPKIISVPLWLAKLIIYIIKPFSLKYYALGRLLLFSYLNDLTTPKRAKKRFLDYLNEK